MENIGLTFGQLIAVISLFGGIVGIYVVVKVAIAKIEVRVSTLEKKQDRDEHKFDMLFQKIDELKDLIINNIKK